MPKRTAAGIWADEQALIGMTGRVCGLQACCTPPRMGHLSAATAKGPERVGGRRMAGWDRHQVQRRLKASTMAATAGRRAGTSRS